MKTEWKQAIARRDFLRLAGAGAAALPLASFANTPLLADEGGWPGLRQAIVLNNLGGLSDPNARLKNFQKKKETGNPVAGRKGMTISPRALEDAINTAKMYLEVIKRFHA